MHYAEDYGSISRGKLRSDVIIVRFSLVLVFLVFCRTSSLPSERMKRFSCGFVRGLVLLSAKLLQDNTRGNYQNTALILGICVGFERAPVTGVKRFWLHLGSVKHRSNWVR